MDKNKKKAPSKRKPPVKGKTGYTVANAVKRTLNLRPEEDSAALDTICLIVNYLHDNALDVPNLFFKPCDDASMSERGAAAMHQAAALSILTLSDMSKAPEFFARYDFHCWSATLKLLLKEMTSRLIRSKYVYTLVVKDNSREDLTSLIRVTIAKMNAKNSNALCRLCFLLRDCASDNERLVHIFASILLWVRMDEQAKTPSSEVLLQQARSMTDVMRILINDAVQVFPNAPKRGKPSRSYRSSETDSIANSTHSRFSKGSTRTSSSRSLNTRPYDSKSSARHVSSSSIHSEVHSNHRNPSLSSPKSQASLEEYERPTLGETSSMHVPHITASSRHGSFEEYERPIIGEPPRMHVSHHTASGKRGSFSTAPELPPSKIKQDETEQDKFSIRSIPTSAEDYIQRMEIKNGRDLSRKFSQGEHVRGISYSDQSYSSQKGPNWSSEEELGYHHREERTKESYYDSNYKADRFREKRISSITESDDAKVLSVAYDFEPLEPDELVLHVGELIYVVEEIDSNWCRGRKTLPNGEEVEGLFPVNHCVAYIDEAEKDDFSCNGSQANDTFSGRYSQPPGELKCIALFKFEPTDHDSELPMKKDEVVTILDSSDVDWWIGENKYGQQGRFPRSLVRRISENDSRHTGRSSVSSSSVSMAINENKSYRRADDIRSVSSIKDENGRRDRLTQPRSKNMIRNQSSFGTTKTYRTQVPRRRV